MRTLIVDDDEAIRAYVEALLTRNGCSTICAASATEAMAVLANELVDLIVTDVFMTGGSGLELLAAIRQIDLDVPVIGMTGGWSGTISPFMTKMRALGAQAVVEKPFGAKVFMEQVKACMPREESHA